MSFQLARGKEEMANDKSSTLKKRRGFQEMEQSRTCDPFMSQHEFIMQLDLSLKKQRSKAESVALLM